MSNPQHAPSPDYSLNEHVDWTVRHCVDCGDICLTETPEQGRCDTCQAEHKSELATAERLLQKHARPMIVQSLRSGGMNDPREILCDGCGEVAVTYTGNADSLERRILRGDCGCKGCVDVDQDDDGIVRVRFLSMEG